MDFISAIEGLALVRALKVSFYAYPIINALHIAAIGALFTSVYLMDLRLLGAFQSIPARPLVALLRRIAIVALIGAAVTGVLMFSVRAGDYAAMPLFLAKMGLIVLGGVNFFAFTRFAAAAGQSEHLSPVLKASLVASMLIWTGVLLCGRFVGFL
jgi:hypothetical protein